MNVLVKKPICNAHQNWWNKIQINKGDCRGTDYASSVSGNILNRKQIRI